jgi:hypothetical protein
MENCGRGLGHDGSNGERLGRLRIEPRRKQEMVESLHRLPGTPHSRYPHVYVIVRLDAGHADPEDALSLPKVFRNEVKAEEEARRLNELNSTKACRYIVVVSRLIDEG